MTETTGGISLSTKKDLSVATVGQTLPGVKIKLKDWAEGDYLVQGKNDIGPCGEILIGGPMVASGKELFRIGQNTSHQISFLKLQLRGAYVPRGQAVPIKSSVPSISKDFLASGYYNHSKPSDFFIDPDDGSKWFQTGDVGQINTEDGVLRYNLWSGWLLRF